MYSGALRSPKDPRNFKVASIMDIGADLPENFELPVTPFIHNQGMTGNCVAQALATFKEYVYYNNTNKWEHFSVGFPYGYPEDTGTGMSVWFAVHNLCKIGNVFSDDFESNAERPLICQQVASKIDELLPKAEKNKSLAYYEIMDQQQAISFMYKYKLPITVVADASYFSPYSNGWHAVSAYGWRNKGKILKVINSWGKEWENSGKGEIEYKNLKEAWGVTENIKAVEDKVFTDIAGHWAESEILKAAKRKDLAGFADNSYGPEKNLTRAEIACILNRQQDRFDNTMKDLRKEYDEKYNALLNIILSK